MAGNNTAQNRHALATIVYVKQQRQISGERSFWTRCDGWRLKMNFGSSKMRCGDDRKLAETSSTYYEKRRSTV
jgi:hypothetical protein